MNAPETGGNAASLSITNFYKVRSMATGKFLSGSKGFYGSETIYASKSGAKSGFTHYKRRNKWHPTDDAQIVEYAAIETATEELT